MRGSGGSRAAARSRSPWPPRRWPHSCSGDSWPTSVPAARARDHRAPNAADERVPYTRGLMAEEEPKPPPESKPKPKPGPEDDAGLPLGLILVGILAAYGLLFILFNSDQVNLSFVFFDAE